MVTSLDINRSDNDPFNADEVESVQTFTNENEIKNIEQNYIKQYTTNFAIDRFVAYQKRSVYFDAVSDTYRNWANQSSTISTGQGITTNFNSSISIPLSNPINSQPTFRVIFNRPIDIRTLPDSSTIKICDSADLTTCVDFKKVILFPTSDTLVLFPIGALIVGHSYQFTFSNVRDYEGNLLPNITLKFSVS